MDLVGKNNYGFPTAPKVSSVRYRGLPAMFCEGDGDSSGRDNHTYLCYTLTAGRNWRGHLEHDSEQHLADFAAFIQESPETRGLAPERSGGHASRFVEAMRNVTTGRRLFSMGPEDEVGLGPSLVQPGDQICVLFGCPMPLCLRYKGGGFLLVGESYLHGYMQGQAIGMWRKGGLQAHIF
jgi:hypothetical protein